MTLARDLMDRQRREAAELARTQAVESAAIAAQHHEARLAMARRHEKELADAWRNERKERKP